MEDDVLLTYCMCSGGASTSSTTSSSSTAQISVLNSRQSNLITIPIHAQGILTLLIKRDIKRHLLWAFLPTMINFLLQIMLLMSKTKNTVGSWKTCLFKYALCVEHRAIFCNIKIKWSKKHTFFMPTHDLHFSFYCLQCLLGYFLQEPVKCEFMSI